MPTLLFFISDIHFTGEQPESEGQVVAAFLKDVQKQLSEIPHSNAYVLIGGDLVQAADNKSYYESFWNNFLIPLIALGIKKENIICVPGNHDIERNWITQNKIIYAPLIKEKYTEVNFNNLSGNEQLSKNLTDKFCNFSNFVKDKLNINNYNPISFNTELNDEWSIYCINSSLTSFGGINDGEYPELKNDEKRLNIDTRRLYSWVNNNLKKKILILHHPLDYLSEWAHTELTKIIKLHFDLVLTGHTHDQDILCNINSNDSYIWCKAPQLYTTKQDKLGYCIIEISQQCINRIIYREWFSKRNAFKPGLDFTETDDGIIKFDNKKIDYKDPILVKIEDRFHDTMAVYGEQPLIWIDRYFSSERFDRSYRFCYDNLYDETDLINSKRNIKIITPAQYGLSSFAWHFILKLWKEHKEFGLYIDSGLIRKAASTEKVINAQLQAFDIKKDNVKRIIIDNWTTSNKNAKQILNIITQTFPGISILILCPMLEQTMIDTENISISEFQFSILYMAPLHTHQIRSMVEVYNKTKHIGQNDIVLKRLGDDIQNFNMHRTPLNCITLLEVFSNSFDDNPVNRTAVIERILRIIFDNEDVPNFKSLPDVKDCEFALGFFCEQMIRNEEFYFGGQEFIDEIYNFCKKQKIDIDVQYLFALLLKNNIICQYEQDLFSFRFAYWVYYFAAMRMTKSTEFAKFILSNEKYAHYPEVIEFYTGSDRTRNDAADIITEDINKISQKVHEKVGVPEKLNPFSLLKLEISDEQVEKTIQQLEINLQHSKLPDEIKDSITDKEYNPSLPFHQSIYKVFENYSVNYLQEIIGIASKTLRNSDYIEPEKKVKLFAAITQAWFETVRVIYLMAPALAKDGIANYDGFGLALSENFNKYKDNPNRLLIAIIAAIPFNLIKWYKDNLYSSKLSNLIYEQIESEKNVVIRHLLICMIIHEQPDGWSDVVKRYLSDINKHSYYFGNTLETLRSMYANGVMSEANIARTKDLIMLSYTKLAAKDNKLHPSNIRTINKKLLPARKEQN